MAQQVLAARLRMTRIFHACDVHGSDLVWSKMVRMGNFHHANVLMMCGDLTGKAMIPVVKRGPNEWFYNPWEREEVLHSEEEVKRTIDDIGKKGYYAFETSMEEIEELKASPEKQREIFRQLMMERVKRWLELVKEKTEKDVKVVINPGNDDHPDIDEIIKADDRVIYPLGRVVDVDDKHPLISCEWVNPSPWKTPRECPEDELRKRLEVEFARVDSTKNLICNFHAPPFRSGLDEAPKLKDLKPVMRFGTPVMEPVGSVAVFDAIKEHQPLLALHGHIHESSGHKIIGRTACVNPGSEYELGVLRGYIVELPNAQRNKMEFWRVEA